ncbi:hypothetical protein PCASD_10901 [Puccinia coronata f. sp. avenae]|uniref:Uncharacterized protein n=1 Tax=Puccinia coronata f. sp. avenae TaxID=200324 RepID=A0A2N5U1Q3_9BASI|nr:hypothetical protein PCASD_10901 [Puccinia coronata f. sp. avenae]
MFFSRFCSFLCITIAIYFLSNGRVAIAPGGDQASSIDQASLVLKRPSSSHVDNPLKQGRYSASQNSRSDGSSGNSPDGGWPRVIPPDHDRMQLDLPGNSNRIPIDDPNHVVIDPPTFQIVATGNIRIADIPREQIAAWEDTFSDFIETTWAPSKRNPIGLPSSSTFPNRPAARVSFIKRNSRLEEWIVPLNRDGEIYDKSDLVERITELHAWLLYTHKIVLRLLGPNGESNHLIHSHDDLVRWFFDELYYPEHGLPVFGQPRPIDGANEPVIGPLQSWVFKLLQNKASVGVTSAVIVGSWHKSRDHVAWQYLFSSDHEFWEAVAQSMIREVNDPTSDENDLHLTITTLKGHPASTIGTSIGGPSPLTISEDKIGNFKFFGRDQLDVKHLETINRSRWLRHLPSRAITGPKEYGSEHGTQILQTSSEYYDNTIFLRATAWYRFPNVGIAIGAEGEKADIRIMSRSQIMIEPSHLKEKIQRLVKHLETVSQDTSALMVYKDGQAVGCLNWNMMELHEGFLKWFGEKLLGRDELQSRTNVQRKFPIVGEVATSRIKVHKDPPYDDAQLFIINLLSSAESRLWNASWVLFGYWLKSEREALWKAFFKTDEEFSYFVQKVSERSLAETP